MQNRFLLFLLACAFLTAGAICAQPAASDPGDAGMTPGLVLVAKVEGEATLILPGNVVSKLKVDDTIPEKSMIRTGPKSSVVLAFSNGATTKLGENTEFEIDTFRMVPLETKLELKDLKAEPTRSRTRLKLNRGELVGDVKPLKINDGTGFVVQTPVGAAGIRGTVFRIVFIPQGNGYAFTLSTVSGTVQFGGLAVGTGGTTQSGTAPGPTVTGSGTGSGLDIPMGQAISFDVEVTTNAQGQQVIVMPTTAPASTMPIPPAVLQQAAVVATEIAVAVQNAVFTPTPPPTGSGGGTSGSGTGSGGTTGSTTGSTTGGTTGTGGSGTTGQTGGSQTTTVTGTSTTGGSFTATVTSTPPPPTPPPPRLTTP